MSGNGEEAVGIDRRLAVLRGDDDGGLMQEALILERGNHLADGTVHEFDLAKHGWCRSACGVGVTAIDSLFDELLPDADGLEVHPKDRWYRRVAGAEVGLAEDPVQHRVDLQLVVALDVLETGGPVAASGVGDR